MRTPRTPSAEAKDTLAREAVESAHCRAALRDGLLLFGTNRQRRVFRTHSPSLARLAYALFDDRITAGRTSTYRMKVAVLPQRAKTEARCDRRMLLRAAFLTCGSLSAPARGHHLEFVPPDAAAAEHLRTLLCAEHVTPKLVSRKGRTVFYFKSADAIARVLAAIGAGATLLRLEDVRALKDTKNRIRRLVNTEAANVDRATSAAAVQREAIAFIADAYGLSRLSPALRRAADLRLGHPTETLAELGRRCDPAVNKSTIGARLASLVRLAARLAASHAGTSAAEKGSRQNSG